MCFHLMSVAHYEIETEQAIFNFRIDTFGVDSVGRWPMKPLPVASLSLWSSWLEDDKRQKMGRQSGLHV